MSDFKLLVDILSSLAALIAIFASLISWYRSAQDPLRVERVIIHKKTEGYAYKLIISNIKNYPVSVNHVCVFNKISYFVEKQQGNWPSIKKATSASNQVFSTKENTEIGANGEGVIEANGTAIQEIPRYFLITIKTTHGSYDIRCKDITLVEFGVQALAMQYHKECKSRFDSYLFVIRQYLKLPKS